MNYSVKVTDEPKWIGNIVELKNNKDISVFVIDLEPKYLSHMIGSVSNGKEYTIDLFTTPDTIYAKGDGICKVMIFCNEPCRIVTEQGKYGITVIVMTDEYNSNFLYSAN